MPNYGRSGRCLTCKRRRVKCDEARPACSPCRRLRLECGGYAKDYSFRDQGHKFASAAVQKSSRKEETSMQEPSQSLLTGADVAVPFFLSHYAAMGRSLAAARGFYETLIPVYNSQPHDSPMSLAISAVASRIFSLWRHQYAEQVQTDSSPYSRAVASLRSALDRPEDRCSPATALAVLALHLYESISAVWDARKAAAVHHNGALSLLPIPTTASFDGVIGRRVKEYVLHNEISSALRQKRLIHRNAYSHLNGPQGLPSVPGNFSLILDSIGVSVAQLQAEYVLESRRRDVSVGKMEQQSRAWIIEAERIGELLQAWARDVPKHWQPHRLISGQDFDSSIIAWNSACDIYPACQIATLWNLWRFHRLVLLKVDVMTRQCLSNMTRKQYGGNEHCHATSAENIVQASTIQELVDEICHSVPFYLGNRSRPSSLTDFTDPEILFPSYHLLTLGDERLDAFHEDGHSATLSVDEHRRHMLAYGAWHAMSPLSNLLTLASDDHGGRLVASCLRPGQLEWIREQFLRISMLLRLPTAGHSGWENMGGALPLSEGPDNHGSTAESLAEQVRKGTRFMSGP